MTKTTPIDDDCASRAPSKVLKEKLLDRSKLTRRRVARALGVSEPRLTKMFDGRCAISAEMALAISTRWHFSSMPQPRDECELYEDREWLSSILAELPAAQDRKVREAADWQTDELQVAA